MSKQEDLISRISKIEEYIELGKKLDSVIDEPKINKAISQALTCLDKDRESCSKDLQLELRIDKLKSELEKDKQKQRIKFEEMRQSFAEKYSDLYGSKETALKHFDTATNSRDKNPHIEAYIDLARATWAGILAYIAAPFSKETSKAYLNLRSACLNASKVYFESIKFNKASEKSRKEDLEQLHDSEFEEARAVSELKKDYKGLTDKAAYRFLDRPELLKYYVLESIREKHAPWL